MTDYLKIIKECQERLGIKDDSVPNYLSGTKSKTPESVFYNNKRKDKPMAKVTAVQILKEAAELKERKSKDYQGGMWSEEDYFPFGDKSYVHMIHTKYLRMRNIVEGDQETNFEALEDTLVDMAVYCAMFAAHIENVKMEKDN